MNDSTLDLFCSHNESNEPDEYEMLIKERCDELGITIDYYMAEFV
jgi:hypothetical protein